MNSPYTEKARKAIENAQAAATALGSSYIGTEHLLLGLAQVEDGVAAKALESQNVTATGIEKYIQEMGNQNNTTGSPQGFTPRTKRIFEISHQEAQHMNVGYVGTEHLLIAILKEQDSIATRILATLGCNIQKLYDDIMAMLSGSGGISSPPMHPFGMPMGMDAKMGQMGGGQMHGRPQKGQTPILDKFSRDFTQMARDNKFDPIVGRDKETERVIQILSRRTKNNPCLVGDPGVGKTAIAEGLAQRIVAGDVPETVKDKRVVALDLSGMVAGTKYRGEFEERIKRVVQEVTSNTNVILFIDELHTLIGAGGAEGALDAANILKPSLARGEMQVIGATTLDE